MSNWTTFYFNTMKLTWFPGSWWSSPCSWGFLVSAAETCNCHSCSRQTPAAHPLWGSQHWQKRPLHQHGKGDYFSNTPAKEPVKGTYLYRELMQDHWRQCFIWSKHLLPDLCSHSDVGYWWNASTGLWLFVLCSGLFKHLLALTKRHNTPTYGRKIKTSKHSQNLQRKNKYTSLDFNKHSFNH